ncbi:P protein [Diachasma alloeum]|uniref:P protein n=1 Tax=Diachasma alloeum TaxID=454923 RepID=UPI0007381062|nr:P protein [Diachasma alloeum]XP_015122185.1 P protein [Diachasma alloeum]
MISLSESSEDETELQTPRSIRRNSRFSTRSVTPGTPSSAISSIVFGPISDEVLRIWSTLPESIRLDPSLAAIHRQYERLSHVIEKNASLNIPGGEQLVNMSVCAQPSTSKQASPTHEKKAYDIDTDSNGSRQSPLYRYTKLVLLTCCWTIFTLILMMKGENSVEMHWIVVPNNSLRIFPISGEPISSRIYMAIEGSLFPPRRGYQESNRSRYHLIIWFEQVVDKAENAAVFQRFSTNVSDQWVLPLLPPYYMDFFPNQTTGRLVELTKIHGNYSTTILRMNLFSNFPTSFPINIGYDLSPAHSEDGIIYGAVVLVGLYVLIIFEVVHRALAAMLASTMSLAILAVYNERPTMTEFVSWIDIDTILLLFSMMIIVAVIAETGLFDYLAVYAYKITGGKIWPLISTLCFFTAALSSILDNVTTVLLMTPVTIRLCEVMELNPVPILTAMLIYSNIGGALTPVGDPPNVIIASNRDVVNAGVDFGTFVLHMSLGVLIVLVVVYGQLRFIFRDISVLGFDEPQDIQDLRHEIAIWQRAAASLSSYSKDENMVRETLVKKVHRLLSLLKKKLMTGSVALEKYKTTLEELQEKYPIRNRTLLIKSGVVLLFVILLFFLHSLPALHLTLGWTALLGVLLLLIIADAQDLDGILARVEWSTLIFFASLFILMEALSRMGLIAWIGKQTEWVILSVSEESRLAVAILLILWVSAFASAFLDNVPLATMMVRIAINLSQNDELNLPLQPLVWALAFGACFGGNATLIGATANVVCAGVAEQHGYRFTFIQFFKVGFPIMVTSTSAVTVYLLIAHVAFNWH